ncbi:MAG TPA: hypothetical protein ENJ35_03175 [Gammaproteobacteria bacterium]|nr:hypothetical protein [Gammaproteobacteria bacterium]
MNLSQFQHSLVESLYSGKPLHPDLIVGNEQDSGFGVYRANLKGNLGSALQDTYPVIFRLTGENFFNLCARHYWRSHHSHSGDLHDYGEHFADFLEAIEDRHGLPYLADVARLEWLAHRAFHAADASAITVSALQQLSENTLDSLHLKLHPSLQLLTSNYPVHRIWQVNQESFEGEDCVELDEGGAQLLIFRSGLEIIAMPVSKGLFHLTRLLRNGESLAAALSATSETDDSFKPNEALFSLFELQLVTGLDHLHFIDKKSNKSIKK